MKRNTPSQRNPVRYFYQANKKAKGSDSKVCSTAGTYIVMHWEFFNKSVSVAIYEICKIVSEFHYVFGASGLQKLGS